MRSQVAVLVISLVWVVLVSLLSVTLAIVNENEELDLAVLRKSLRVEHLQQHLATSAAIG